MNKNKIWIAQYKRHLLTKKDRMEKLKQKLKSKKIETAEDYMKILNSVCGEKRHQSRQRVLKMEKR